MPELTELIVDTQYLRYLNARADADIINRDLNLLTEGGSIRIHDTTNDELDDILMNTVDIISTYAHERSYRISIDSQRLYDTFKLAGVHLREDGSYTIDDFDWPTNIENGKYWDPSSV